MKRRELHRAVWGCSGHRVARGARAANREVADHRFSWRKRADGPNGPLCAGIVPVFAAIGAGNHARWEVGRRLTQICGH